MSSAPDLSKLRGVGRVRPSNGPSTGFKAPASEEQKQRLETGILKYARSKLNQKAVDRGECWDLPYQAILTVKAKTPHELGDLDVWGEEVPLSEARPGDILQFEKVKVRRGWVEDGVPRWSEASFNEKHSAIILSVGKDNFFTLANQHVKPHKGKVTELTLNLSPENVTGTIKAYRPLPKD